MLLNGVNSLRIHDNEQHRLSGQISSRAHNQSGIAVASDNGVNGRRERKKRRHENATSVCIYAVASVRNQFDRRSVISPRCTPKPSDVPLALSQPVSVVGESKDRDVTITTNHAVSIPASVQNVKRHKQPSGSTNENLMARKISPWTQGRRRCRRMLSQDVLFDCHGNLLFRSVALRK